ncbi:hypothetical protein PABG_04831 [Paracoccidioides brasiliensis Pb03]|nr:hypothetical protein PABG_04831 [Paracoccidioides brasiliensis Pb03]
MDTSDPIVLEPNSLYILLFRQGEAYQFHWGLFLTTTTSSTPAAEETVESPESAAPAETTATTSPPGTLFELINPNPSNSRHWTYSTSTLATFTHKNNPISALKISTIEPILHEPVHALLATIPVVTYSHRFGEDMSCRVWLKEALYALDQSGFIQLVWTVDEIEKEAKGLGMLCWCSGIGRGNATGRVKRSAGCLF